MFSNTQRDPNYIYLNSTPSPAWTERHWVRLSWRLKGRNTELNLNVHFSSTSASLLLNSWGGQILSLKPGNRESLIKVNQSLHSQWPGSYLVFMTFMGEDDSMPCHSKPIFWKPYFSLSYPMATPCSCPCTSDKHGSSIISSKRTLLVLAGSQPLFWAF